MTSDPGTGARWRRATDSGTNGDLAVKEFTELLRLCDPSMRALAFGILRDGEATDDALQLAYLKAYRKFDSFEERSSFSTWLYTIVYRTCIDEIRKRRPNETIDSLETRADTAMDVGDQVELSMSINDALGRLPAQQRAVVLLVDGHGLSFQEAATTLGVPVGTVGSRLTRARTALRIALQGDDHYEDQL